MDKILKKNIAKSIMYYIFLVIISVSCKEESQTNVLKKYFPKEKEVVFFEYIIVDKDTILDGKYIIYNYDGKKIKSGFYKNGKSIGKIIHYYNNGNIESIENKNSNGIITDAIFNYRNGKIERYILYDDFGKTAFIARFNKNQTLKNYEGYVIMETYQYKLTNKKQFDIKENQYLKVGDRLNYIYLVANIPNTKRSFTVENLSIDESQVKRNIIKTSPTKIFVNEIITKKGTNTIRSIVKYEFKDKVTPVFTDTLTFEVYVN